MTGSHDRTASARLSAKARQFSESVIREMTRHALAHGAVNLAQGFPDFPCPEEIKEAACRAIRGDVNQYAITWGAKGFREALAAKVGRTTGMRIDPEREITVTCGSTEAMIAALLAVVDPGDEVVVFEPFYENYGPDAVLCGATPRFVSLRPVSGEGGGADLGVRPCRAAPRVRPAHPRGDPEHAEQPDREGLLARGARGDRRAVRRARLPGDHRRDLRAHPLRRARARADRDAAGDARAHDHDQRAEQDLLGDRLAHRLRDRAAGADGRHPQGARLPDGRRRRARCRRRGSRRSRSPTRTTAVSPTCTAPSATVSCRCSSERGSAASRRRGPTT